MQNLKWQSITTAALLMLSACGGDAGPTAGGALAPTVTITVTPTRVALGENATLAWSSTNATSCSASNAWSGAQATSGSISVKPAAIGQTKFALACTGTGGTASQTAILAVPMPVFASSYENAKNIVLSDPNIVKMSDLGITLGPGFPANVGGFSQGFAFADFFQEGDYSAVVSTERTPTGTIYFLRKNASGVLVEATGNMLSDQTGCLHVRKAIVADFNGDKKPDVFFSCTGVDAVPFDGEAPRILLSQPNGTYSNTLLPFVGFYHGAAAADLTGDGRPDIVVTSTGQPDRIAFVLVNNGAGTFTQDFSLLPASLKGRSINVAELIDLRGTGQYDLLLGGNAVDANGNTPPANTALYQNGYFRNDGNGRFLTTPYFAFANPVGGSGNRYNLGLDFILRGGFIYMYQVDRAYANVRVLRVSLSDLSVTSIYEHLGEYPACPVKTWWSWIYPMGNAIVAQDDNVTKPINPLSCHGVSIPI